MSSSMGQIVIREEEHTGVCRTDPEEDRPDYPIAVGTGQVTFNTISVISSNWGWLPAKDITSP